MKPMLKYRGGKAKEIAEILPFIPKSYERYIEPFFGGGALYFHLSPEKALINDLNTQLMHFYRSVRDDYDVLSSELAILENLYHENRCIYDAEKLKTPNDRVPDRNEDLYYLLRDMFNGKIPSEYSPSAVYYFINKTAYSGMIRYNRSGDYNVPYGRYRHFNTKLVSRAHSELLAHATICVGDYQEVFKQCVASDFVFLDPPYDCVFSDYGNKETINGFGEKEHRRLCDAFYELPCKALMVIGKTDFTYSLYKDSVVHEYPKSYSVNIRNRFKSASNHILVANY